MSRSQAPVTAGPAPTGRTFGRAVAAVMVPLDVILLVWVWCGRAFFGLFGWYVIGFALTLVPLLAALLAAKNAAALAGTARPRALTPVQSTLQVLVWLALLVLGLTVPEVSDDPSSATSLLNQAAGPTPGLLALSEAVAAACVTLSLVLLVLLVVLLLLGRRRAAPRARR